MLKSNLFISIAAVFLTIETQIQLGLSPQWHPYLFIIFFATLFEYNLHRLITVITNKKALDNEKHSWVKDHLILFYTLVACSAIGFIISLLLAKKEVMITLAPFALITIFYSLPVFKNKQHIFRLREIPLLKIFLIGIVWASITVLLPVIQSEVLFNKTDVLLIYLERFFFLFAITIPFDVRDMEADQQSGLKTIPLLIGQQRSQYLANFCLIVFLLMALYHYGQAAQGFMLWAFSISAVSTMYFINNKKLSLLPNYHYGILDGTMLVQGVLVYLLHFISH